MLPVLVAAAVLLRALPGSQQLAPETEARERSSAVDDVRAMTILGVRHRPPQRRLVRAPDVRAAVGGRERRHGGGGKPDALADARSPARSERSCSARSPIASGSAGRSSSRRSRFPFLVIAFVAVGGVLGTVALMLVGLCVVGTFGVTMVLSQLYLPRHVGMASGLSVGLAMGLGGIAAVALGVVADAIDLETALYVAAVAPGLGAVALPRPARDRSRSPPRRLRRRWRSVRLHPRLNRQSTRRRVTR